MSAHRSSFVFGASGVLVVSLLASATALSLRAANGEGTSDEALEAAAAFVVACRHGEPALLGVFEAVDGAISFSLPGGTARAGEDAVDTAQRETLEETGYRVRALHALPAPDSARAGFKVLRARLIERRRAYPASSEIVAAAWVDPARIPRAGWRFERDSQWVPRLFQRHAPEQCS